RLPFARAGRSRVAQDALTPCRRISFDGIAQRRPRNSRALRAKVALEPIRIGFSRFAKHPADRFLNQILAIGMEPFSDFVGEVERLTAPRQRNEGDGSGPPYPHAAVAR